MDTKLKKSKAVIGFISWMAGISILFVNLVRLFLESSYYEDFGKHIEYTFQEDYQQDERFREHISDYLDVFLSMSIAGKDQEKDEREREEDEYWEAEVVEGMDGFIPGWDDYYDYYGYEGDTWYEYGWDMDKKTAENYHNMIKDDRNILYRIEKSGTILFTNEENLGSGGGSAGKNVYCYELTKNDGSKEIFSLPEGYNFLLYFDGNKVEIWKDGGKIDIYGNGYYQEERGWYVPGYRNFIADDAVKESEVYIAAAKIPSIYVKSSSDGRGTNYRAFYNIWKDIQIEKSAYIKWANTTIFAVFLLFIGFIFRKERKEAGIIIAAYTGKVWYEIKLLPLVAVSALFIMLGLRMINDFFWMGESYIYEMRFGYLYYPGLGKITCLVFFFCILTIWMFANDRYYNKEYGRNSLIGKLASLYRTSSLRLPISKRIARNYIGISLFIWIMCIVCAFFIIAVIEGILTAGIGLTIFIVLLAAILYFPIRFVRCGKKMAEAMENLVGQIQAIHDGELWERNEIWEGFGLSKAVENLDDIKNGMQEAVKEQMKSERMKVELVANVSHDIKTPLTSIISYVDLLKQEDDLPEHVKEYVMILDHKSQRLKSMVQDIFEVSKAVSGNLPVNMENLDLGKLLRQTIADMEGQMEKSLVNVKMRLPENAVVIYADGERIYRVFQNLIQNALNYSLEGSRVYITLQEDGEMAIACVKSISKEEIPSGMDFTERFTRGDKSRSDGGSGLGLSIAKSFTEACGGHFKIETVADLFIVTVSFQKIKE